MMNEKFKAWFKTRIKQDWNSVEAAFQKAGITLTSQQKEALRRGEINTELEGLFNTKIYGFLGWKEEGSDYSQK